MGKYYQTAILATMAAFTAVSCNNNMESQIVGKYEHSSLPGQTFDFKEGNLYVNTLQAGTADCTIDYTGTWTVDGDSLIVELGAEGPNYHFGKEMTQEQQDNVKKLAESGGKGQLQRLAFRIAGVDSLAISLERNGEIITYKRIK